MKNMMKSIGIFILGLLWGLLPVWDCMNSVGGGHGTYILIAISYGTASLLALLAPLLYVGYAFLLWYYPKWSLGVLLFDICSICVMILGLMAASNVWVEWTQQTGILCKYWQLFGFWGIAGVFTNKILLLTVVVLNYIFRNNKAKQCDI